MTCTHREPVAFREGRSRFIVVLWCSHCGATQLPKGRWRVPYLQGSGVDQTPEGALDYAPSTAAVQAHPHLQPPATPVPSKATRRMCGECSHPWDMHSSGSGKCFECGAVCLDCAGPTPLCLCGHSMNAHRVSGVDGCAVLGCECTRLFF
jgi:hypothetical protein